MSKQKTVTKVFFFCAVFVLVLVIAYSGLRILESTVFRQAHEPEDTVNSKVITYEGVDYFPRQDITVMMILGIDQFGPMESSGSQINNGSADVAALLIFDEAARNCRVLTLNRDTMVNMPVIDETGKRIGTGYAQLALAHTFGSGLEDSCEYTREAVSGLLLDTVIDYYVAMNMDALAILNDAVGGVTVNITDDFSAIDPELIKGEVTLHGEQALTFVRSRRNLGDQLNVSRMDRQRVYMDAFVRAFQKKLDDSDTFVIKTYDKISPYMVSDCSVNAISGMMERYQEFEIVEVVSPEGENVLGEAHYEFYPDEEKLKELTLRLFYAPKK